MTKIHCTLAETVKRGRLQTLGHLLDHLEAEVVPHPPWFLWCSVARTESVRAGDISVFANDTSAPELRESPDSFSIAFCLEKCQHDVSFSQCKREVSLKDIYFLPLDLDALLAVFQLAS